LIDRGVLQGVLVVQTREPRIFREAEIRILSEAAAQVAPVISEARTLDRFIAPAQEKLWALARISGGAGTTTRTASFATSTRPAGASSITIRSHCSARSHWPRSSAVPTSSCSTVASTTRIAACRSTSTPIALGAPPTPASSDPGPWPTSPPSSDSTNPSPLIRAAWASSRRHIKSASDVDIPLIGVGLYWGYFRQRLDSTGWQQEEYLQTDINQLPMEPAIAGQNEPVTVRSKPAPDPSVLSGASKSDV
jgi:starch phosphorylase